MSNVKWKTKVCPMCNTEFTPKSSRSIFCGSRTNKTGCSYQNRLTLSIKSQERNKEYRSKYIEQYNIDNKTSLTEYRKIHYNNRKLIVRDYQLQRKYNISLDEYNKILESQNNVCFICKKPEQKQTNLAVDHCHTTGKVRGLLCTKCNTTIGLMDESIENLQSAINYLDKWKQ
jgi:hypothetical protein